MKRESSSIRTIKSHLCTGLAVAAVALFQPPAAAEDIDLFVQPAPEVTGLPNVLIILDNTANWNTPFTNEIAALVATLNELPVDSFRVGLMLFTETGSPNNPIDGGYVRAAVRDLTATTTPLYKNLFSSLHVLNDKSNGGKAGLTMMEAFYYYDAQNPRSGNNKVKTDYRNNNVGSPASKAIYALQGTGTPPLNGNALPARDGTRAAGPPYNSPVIDGSCAGNFIIYISNGAVQDNAADNQTARLGLAAEGGNTTTIALSPSGSQTNMADEWARYMFESEYGVVTYTLDVDPITTGQGPGWSELLQSMAVVSQGEYYAVNSGSGGANIKLKLKDVFSKIQAVNSVFASVALPVSVNTEGTYLNQIYIGMFRPDAAGLPRWSGNLKQYKLGLSNGTTGVLQTQDADSTSAINNQTGFITECARSFWTLPPADGGADNYWNFRPQGGCLVFPGSADDNSPDGNVVEKGAQAYKLRSPAAGRTPFKTCSDGISCGPLLDFDSSSVTDTELGAVGAEHGQLINWARGLDVDDAKENNNGKSATSSPTERRPSIHGDVVHSRPVAVNMGTDDDPEVVVFYGGNDGVLRAVNGNRTASIDGVEAGQEMWAFVAPEFYPSIKRLRDNTVPLNYFGNTFAPPTPTPLPKPYGFDGPIIAHHSGSNLWLYGTLRRGGRTIYAFDVSDINTDQTSPGLMWKVGCDATGCTSTNFTEMGQSWSAPQVLRAAGYNDGGSPAVPTPMLFFGGGYDTCEDADPNNCDYTGSPAVNKGNRIYLVDAEDGTWLAEFATERGVAADVFVVKDDAGLAQWAYAADLGGNIYRISGADANTPFADWDPEGTPGWTITKIASVGCDTPGGCSANRKFMMSLDVVKDDDGSLVILVGSGDREKPLMGYTAAYGVSNYFFKIVDHPADPLWLDGECSGADLICLDSLLAIGVSDPEPEDLLLHPKGWYLGLNAHEQAVTSAITVFGTTTFSTHTPHVPVEGSCTSTLGTARVYNIDFENAASRNGTEPANRSEEIVGGGLPPSPVAGMVTLDNGITMPFLIGGETNSPLEGGEPIPSGIADQPKAQTYWYIHK